ncbi:hypothetical protein B0T24DRAFT_334182 [Lasiosphaeria ovina]|uniref:non-specific serine/threonine protein kinase n=1 Tax=Lasiosphaeria ovina TaxID=92902 RepID=A0AAE0K887_9PEZI|nr:hypothetical protein B0T24DRAFT_334182 [Lasiosphaeria ovina]
MDSDLEPSPWKYLPFELGESENLENYEPGGFHPVHLGDVYDDDDDDEGGGGRYRVAHKLGFGGFSTVWLARDALASRWVAVKIVAARESPTYNYGAASCTTAAIADSRLFAAVEREFWLDGPNGRHLCLVSPVLGPDLARLSNGIYARIALQFAL